MRYRKRGSVVRWENGTVVRVRESGVAIEEGERFECHPEPADIVEQSSRRVVEIAEEIRGLVTPPLSIERLIVSDGVAEHECEGRVWTDTTLRFHAALVHRQVRVLVDRFEDAARIADSLSRLAPARPAPPRLRFAPNVTAALLPSLAGLAPPNVRLIQSGGAIDGKGRDVEEVPIGREPWPNWYRPSYRVRPVRMPFDLRIECSVTEIDASRPVAVALLEPADGLGLHVLVDDGETAWPARVRVTRIDAVASERIRYPHGAGSFGAALML